MVLRFTLDQHTATTTGLQLDAVVANFHDDGPGMLGRDYSVDVD